MPTPPTFIQRLKTPARKLRKLLAEPVVTSIYTNDAIVGLTFDDGPSPPYTQEVLDILKHYGAKATFFLLGQNCLRWPELSRRIVEEGHAIGNHTSTHLDLEKVGPEEALKEIRAASKQIKQATNQSTALFRPPYGRYQQWIFPLLRSERLRLITWSIDPVRWSDPRPEIDTQHVIKASKRGSIIVLHDGIDGSVPQVFQRQNTIECLPKILEGLQKKGLQAVTIPELLACEI